MSEQPLLSTWGTATPTEPSRASGDENYLINNWRLIQATESTRITGMHQFIKVYGGVATVFGDKLVVRCTTALPDGFYLIDRNNNFIPANPNDVAIAFRQSRDVETIKPLFNRMDWAHQIVPNPGPDPSRDKPPVYAFTRKDCAEFIAFLSHLRQDNREHLVVLGHEVAMMVHRQDLWYKFPCVLPVKGDGLVFQANHLRLAFTEMLRYDHIFVGRDNFEGVTSYHPLVLGIDWEHCAIVMHKIW